jgi:glycosyltransferase involved in cell wall biosynthesis
MDRAPKKLLNTYRHWRVGGWAAVRRFWSEMDGGHAHVLSTDPAVVYLWWERDTERLHYELRDRPLIALHLFPWRMGAESLPAAAEKARVLRERYRRHRVVFLCNEEPTVEPLRRLGAEALFVNQNAFVNENVFQPRAGAEPTHDAVYNAAMSPYKRHLLARKVASLIIMTYVYGGTANALYEREVREALAHAWWAKDSRSDAERFPTARLVEIYHRARVGLCLSSIEGAMFASMEYLLCGLPVVSTRAVGGREAFWDDRYVTVCEDTPEAVAAAVEEMKNRRLDPAWVRQLTLEKVAQHRQRLKDFLAQAGVSFVCPWPPGAHGVTSFTNLRTVAQAIRRKAPATELP